jgi:cystathionine beta-lyase/cystathionine gamma-synthase
MSTDADTPTSLGFATRAVHAGEAPDPTTGAHGVPLFQNATYAFQTAAELEAAESGRRPHFFYARYSNPTVRCLEVKLADLDGAADAAGAASGMAALAATVLHLTAGCGHLVVSDTLYYGTQDLLAKDLPAAGASVTAVDATDPAAVEAAIRPETRAILVETFANPTLRVADVPVLAELAKRHGARLVVDNTFLSPALYRPLADGADLVVHSATKYLAGHGMALGGVVAGDRRTVGEIREKLVRLGATMPAFNAWMILAGIKTLPLRLRQQSENGLRLARLLHDHPAVAAVNYPGLPDDPGHAIARRLAGDRCGGLLSFTLGGGEAARGAFLNALRLCTIAVSLGECGTLVWPFPGRDLIRLSAGIEDPEDLEADLRQALDRAAVGVGA